MSDILVGNEPAELAAAPSSPASSVEQRPLKSLQQYSELQSPKTVPSQSLGGILDTIPSPLSTMPVMSPFEYLSSLPSKGVRNQLVQALNLWIGVPPEVLLATLSIIRDIHNISLMLDDVEDGSPLRRSQPSTHSVFGVPQTINSATYQVVEVISRTAQVCGAACHGIVVDEMKNMLIGQSHDLFWVSHVSAPTVPEYLKMIDGSALFRMIARLMIAQSSSPHKPANLDRLMILFGRYFQIRDDYANLVVDQYQDSKGFCEDLDEGKWSFILLHALENASLESRCLIQNLLMQRHANGAAAQDHKQLFLGILQETGSLHYTAEALWALWTDIDAEVRAIETSTGNPNMAIREMMVNCEFRRRFGPLS